jgi:hypothetical protein
MSLQIMGIQYAIRCETCFVSDEHAAAKERTFTLLKEFLAQLEINRP